MNKNIFVLDTNVLLNEPQAIYKFPNSVVIIPQAVLKELDKIKMTRADKVLQHHGRQVSRYLFTISAAGNLTDGVELENGSIVKVVDLDPQASLPQNLKTKFIDDQIIAITYSLNNNNRENKVTLVTNDLNMLVKAQSLGLNIEHHSGLSKQSKFKRFINNQFATLKKNPIMALFAILIIGGFISILIVISNVINTPLKGPPELVAKTQQFKSKENHYINLIDNNSSDIKAIIGLSELYIEMGHYYQDAENYNKALEIIAGASEKARKNERLKATSSRLHFYLEIDDIAYSELNEIAKTKNATAFSALMEQANKAYEYKEYSLAIVYYKKAISIMPKNIDTRMDLASAYYDNDQIDESIKELHKALEVDNKHAIIYYNLGLVYWQKKHNNQAALSYFEKYLELEPQSQLSGKAKENIDNIKKNLR